MEDEELLRFETVFFGAEFPTTFSASLQRNSAIFGDFGLFLEYLSNNLPSFSQNGKFECPLFLNELGQKVEIKNSADMEQFYQELLRCNQSGLSFRIYLGHNGSSNVKESIDSAMGPAACSSTLRHSSESTSSEGCDEESASCVFGQFDVDIKSISKIALIGRGGFGSVYKALDMRNDRVMAVKCLPLDVDVDTQRRIETEVQVLSQCRSPYIIEFYAAFFQDGVFSICTELMEGGSLSDYSNLLPHVVSPIACSVINGLHYLWQNRIMHRDVKPSNVLLGRGGAVKLADFGVSAQLERSVTRSYVGTGAYMAPERMHGGVAYRAAPADVWSLAVTLLEVAIGRYPFAATRPNSGECQPNARELMEAIVVGRVPDFKQQLLSSGWSTEFVDLVYRCLCKDPASRISPQQLIAHPLVIRNTPIDSAAVAKLVAEKLALK